MSAEATGYVVRYSPFRGATFLVHVMIADTVNDQHENELWMSQASLAAKSRVSDRSVRRALDELTAAGYLTLLEDRSLSGKTNRYRFEYPQGAIQYESRGGHSVLPPRTQVPTPPDKVSYRTQENSKQHNHKGSDKVSYLPGAFIPGSGYIAGPECDKCAGMGVVEQPDGTAVECECKRAAS